MEVKETLLASIASFFNVVLMLIGIALTTVGGYLYGRTSSIGTTVGNEIAPVMIILLVIGSVLMVTAVVSIIGVFRKQSILLAVVLVCMVLVLLGQFASVVILFTSEASLHYYITSGMTTTVKQYGDEKDVQAAEYTESMDWVHQHMKCCGHWGWKEWGTPNQNSTGWSTNTTRTASMSVPDSCCKTVTTDCGSGVLTEANIKSETPPDSITEILYTEACFGKTKDHLEFWLTLAGCMALVFMFIQVMAVFLITSLHKRFKDAEDYKLQKRKPSKVVPVKP